MAAEIRTTALTAGDTVVRAAPATLHGYWFKNLSGTAMTVTIYDNTTATGTKILTSVPVAATTGDTGMVMFPHPIRMTVGLSVNVAGAGTLTVSYVVAD
jgi:hypothetical protein